MLSHKKDIFPALLVLVTTCAQVALYICAVNLPILVVVLLSCIIFFLCAVCVIIAHNHAHCAMFKYKFANIAVEYMYFFQHALTPYFGKIQHVLMHHNFYMDQSKEPQPWLKDNKPVNKFDYVFFGTLGLYSDVFRYSKSFKRLETPFSRHFAGCMVLLMLLVAVNPLGAVFAFILPASLALFNLTAHSWAHHNGLSLTDPWAATRSDVNVRSNWFLFNIGYHTAHHYKPAVHWSELPELHARIAHKIPEHLIYK